MIKAINSARGIEVTREGDNVILVGDFVLGEEKSKMLSEASALRKALNSEKDRIELEGGVIRFLGQITKVFFPPTPAKDRPNRCQLRGAETCVKRAHAGVRGRRLRPTP